MGRSWRARFSCARPSLAKSTRARIPLFNHEELLRAVNGQKSARLVLSNCVVPMLEAVGSRLSGCSRDTIWIDSLDEALTRSVTGGAQSSTIVSLLVDAQKMLPPWVRVAGDVAARRDDQGEAEAALGSRIGDAQRQEPQRHPHLCRS